jgi:hypothetical protein
MALCQRADFTSILAVLPRRLTPPPSGHVPSGTASKSDQPAANGESRKPGQADEADRAEHRGRAVIFDPTDGEVMLRRDVIRQLLNRGVEEFNGKQPKQRTDHRHIPGQGWSDEDGRNEPRNQQDQFFAQRRFVVKAVADSPQGIDGRGENSFHNGNPVERLRRENACTL